MCEWNRANKMSNFWSTSETCCLRVEKSARIRSSWFSKLSMRCSSLSMRMSRTATEGEGRKFGIWKEFFTVQRAVRRWQDGGIGDEIHKKEVVLVKRNLRFQKGSFDLRRRSRYCWRCLSAGRNSFEFGNTIARVFVCSNIFVRIAIHCVDWTK